MAGPAEFGMLRTISNNINIAYACRWTWRKLHRQPVITVSVLMGLLGR
jgi:hypothetical protein